MKKLILLMLFSALGFQLSAQISGKIIGDDGTPLIGATVVVVGTTNGTVTDTDGKFTINAKDGDRLLITYVGQKSRTVTVGQDDLMNIGLSSDSAILDELVVTATRQPVRKIQTTTAITSIGAEELTSIQPESIAEAITAVPGVTVENSQGRKSNYNIRGFPSGNTYVTTMLDGLPLSGFASRSAGTVEFLGLDKTIERVEVVRGSGATLFGRAAGAGAVNMISRSGGDEFGGGVSFTTFNKIVGDDLPTADGLDNRIDFHFGGPIGDKIRFSVGGYNLVDSGYKEWAVKDRGTQVSGNIDFNLSERIDLRVYGSCGNNQFNNLTDAPYDLGARKIADGWTTANTYYANNSQLDFESTLFGSAFAPSSEVLDVNGNTITQNQANDNREEVVGGMLGVSLSIGLTDNLTLVHKSRIQNYDWRDQNEITFSSFYSADSRILRLNANSIGDISDFLSETRFQYTIDNGNSKHYLNAGFYRGSGTYDRFGGLHWYTADVNPRPTYGWFGPPGTPPPTIFSLSSTSSHQEEAVTSFFIGDEMVFNEKLSLNVGFRYDQMTGFFNNDPDVVGGVDYAPETLIENELDFGNWSASIGANYLLAERTAVYGSFVRAFSLPSVGLSTPLPEEDEIVTNMELGFRFGAGDLGIDIAGFNTSIINRVASVFDPDPAIGQTFVNKPVGRNNVRGAELQLTYAPLAVKGLLARASLTLQSSQFADDADGNAFVIAIPSVDDDENPDTPNVPGLDINNNFGLQIDPLDAANGLYGVNVSGNQVQNTPSMIVTFNLGYNAKYFGVGLDAVHYAGRYATALNLYETPDLTIVNGNLYGRYVLGNDSAIKLGVRVKNLLGGENPQQLVLGSTSPDILAQKQATPDFTNTLGFATMQIPRRILLTVGYDF